METREEFSIQLLESISLRDVYISSDEFSSPISRSHGAIVELENGNKLYDLRPYDEKPIIGHAHPLILKNAEINVTENKFCDEINFFTTDEFVLENELNKNKGFFCFYTTKNNIVSYEDFLQSSYYKFIDVVLVKGERVRNIKETLFEKLEGLEVQGLKINTKKKITQDRLNRAGIYTSDQNFQKEETSLYLPTAILDIQLIDFCNRLKKVIEE